MKGFLRKIGVQLSAQYALMMEYRAEIFFWVLAGIFPFILMGVWMKVAAQGDSVFSEVEFARYFLAVFIVRQLTIIWVIYEFEWYVVEGRMSGMLLRPMDPAWQFIAGHLGEQLTRLPFWILLVAFFFWLYPQALYPLPNWLTLLQAAGLIFCTYAVRFVLQYSLAMLSFWIERAGALEQLNYVPYLFLSGFVAPLELFPPTVRMIAEWTPFPYMLYYPATLLAGRPVNMGKAVLVMSLWFVALFVINRILWRRGLRQYSGMGA